MSEELLRDLTAYKSYRDKSVMMAARSLIHLYRDLNPDMLHRKDRVRAWLGCGLEASMLDSSTMTIWLGVGGGGEGGSHLKE
jgi:hypothetical protein